MVFGTKKLIRTNTNLERVHVAGAKFDYEKAKWFNHEWIKKLALSDSRSVDSWQLAAKTPNNQKNETKNQKRFSYKEKREFDVLEKEIADLNKEKEIITEKLSSSNTSFEELQKISSRILEITQLIDEKEIRWLELSEMAQ